MNLLSIVYYGFFSIYEKIIRILYILNYEIMAIDRER